MLDSLVGRGLGQLCGFVGLVDSLWGGSGR